MFEEEIKMEQRSSNIVPLLLIVGLLAVVVGTVVYTILEVKAGKKAPTSEEARGLVTQAIAAKRPAVTRFRVGTVKPAPGDQVAEVNYRLLEKAGLITIKKGKAADGVVTLTPQGEQVLNGIADIKTAKNRDGSTTYTVPLAERRLVEVLSVTMERPNVAQVQYTWQWTPNAMGDVFDATGPTAMKLNMWDRGTLIQKYGADLYRGKPEKDGLRVMHTDHGWIIPTD